MPHCCISWLLASCAPIAGAAIGAHLLIMQMIAIRVHALGHEPVLSYIYAMPVIQIARGSRKFPPRDPGHIHTPRIQTKVP
jgi:hypothetical protein